MALAAAVAAIWVCCRACYSNKTSYRCMSSGSCSDQLQSWERSVTLATAAAIQERSVALAAALAAIQDRGMAC